MWQIWFYVWLGVCTDMFAVPSKQENLPEQKS